MSKDINSLTDWLTEERTQGIMAVWMLITGIILFLLLLVLDVSFLTSLYTGMFISTILIVMLLVSFKQSIPELKSTELNNVLEVTYEHIDVLAKKYAQAVEKDDYGNILYDRWIRELDYFFEKVIEDKLEYHSYATIYNLITDEVTKHLEQTPINEIFDDNLSPLEYESYCEILLSDNGWEATTTTASNDQGVDVVAHKDGITLVLQCKLYSKPVGNKAVQEINAGRDFYNADYAAVVSNVTYTRSATELANKLHVLLLHHSNLSSNLSDIIDELESKHTI